jgi:DNA polymerase III epsilon subunit-like protein
MPRHHFLIKRTGLQWTEEEDVQLLENIKLNKTIYELSMIHKRSKGSILTRMNKLKNKMPHTDIKEPELKYENDPEVTRNVKTLVCIFDTETTGLPPYKPITNSNEWPRMVQFACKIYDKGELIREFDTYIKPDGFDIPEESTRIHKITNEIAHTGMTIKEWCHELSSLLDRVYVVVAHNMMFDNNIIQSELYRANEMELLQKWKHVYKECTMMMGKKYIQDHKIDSRLKLTDLCKVLHIALPSENELHNARVDTDLCSALYIKLKELGISNTRYDILSVYDDKDILKHLGARWDSGQKTWYIYDNEPFSRYIKKWFKKNTC